MNIPHRLKRRHRLAGRSEGFAFFHKCKQGFEAFTLVETLVSLAIIALLLVILLSMTNQITALWTYTSGRGEQFRESREAFETITRRLSLATLNTYWDYADSSGNARTSANSSTFTPVTYARQSELRFISGPMGGSTSISGTTAPPAGASWPSQGVFFQAPRGVSEPGVSTLSGLYSMLNTWGYFVEFGPDSSSRPGIPGLGDETRIPYKYRFRLCEMIQPANQLSIYQYTSGPSGSPTYTGIDWFSASLGGTSRPVHVLAENVIALVLLPKLASGDETAGGYTDSSLAPNYLYDSTGTNMGAAQLADKNLNPKNQLPPIIQVTMVAVDEASYGRFQSGTTMPANLGLATLFQTAGSTTDNTVPGYAKDLQTLQNTLLANKINYRVFTSSIKIKGAKWSEDQTN
ncbi:MAG: Verru_Chthon cassette protein C [Chthoniobacteraceae bacterium]